LSPPPAASNGDNVDHFVSGQGFVQPEFSEEPEITQEEVLICDSVKAIRV
jgi:hypothetical protein